MRSSCCNLSRLSLICFRPSSQCSHTRWLQEATYALHTIAIGANPSTLLQLIQAGSVKAHRLQKVFTAAIYKDALSRQLGRATNPQDYARMLSLSYKNPFPNLDLSDPACRLDNSVTVAIARLHLGLQPTSQIGLDRNAVCVCGFRLSNDTHHFTSCSQLNRQQVLCHDGGYKAVVESLEACGIHTRTEHHPKGTQQRVDVSYVHPATGQRVDIDFTIAEWRVSTRPQCQPPTQSSCPTWLPCARFSAARSASATNMKLTLALKATISSLGWWTPLAPRLSRLENWSRAPWLQLQSPAAAQHPLQNNS